MLASAKIAAAVMMLCISVWRIKADDEEAPKRLQSDVVFSTLDHYLKMSKQIQDSKVVMLWIITRNGDEVARWTFDVKKNSVFAGDPDGYAPDITFTIDDADLMDMALGRISSAKALFARKLKIDGDLKLAMKFDYWKYMKFRIDE